MSPDRALSEPDVVVQQTKRGVCVAMSMPFENDPTPFSLAGIDAKSAVAVKELHRRDPQWTWICALYPAVWGISVFMMERFPFWPIRVVGVVAIGISIQAMAILMHEALHRNLFRKPAWDLWAAFILLLPAFFSGTAYKVVHLNHHRHTRTARDQDDISNHCHTMTQYHVALYVRYLAGTFLYFFVVPIKALSIAGLGDRRRIIGEYVAMVGIYAAVIAVSVAAGRTASLFWYWLLPVLIAIVLSNVRGNAEHVGTGIGAEILISRTVTSTRLVSFLMCNLNYHLEHHLFPGIPWYNLPKAHRLLQTAYAQTGAHVERSYIRLTIRALSGALDMVHRESVVATRTSRPGSRLIGDGGP